VTADEIRQLPLFAELSDAALERVVACGELENEPGQVLVLPGDHGSGMFVVVDGTVTVELHRGQVEVGPGGVIGELALLVPGATRVARARAATRTRCLCLPRDDFVWLVDTELPFARAVLRLVAQRLHDTIEGYPTPEVS
jgi:CRP-like cAMP-binding protein